MKEKHIVDGVLVDHIEQAAPMPLKREEVADYAERLIIIGTEINGIQFKCDGDSLRRLNALMRGFERGAVGPEGKTYETAAGIPITFKTKEEVEAVLNIAEDYESALLERSAEIQLNLNDLQGQVLDLSRILPHMFDVSRPLAEIMGEFSSPS